MNTASDTPQPVHIESAEEAFAAFKVLLPAVSAAEPFGRAAFDALEAVYRSWGLLRTELVSNTAMLSDSDRRDIEPACDLYISPESILDGIFANTARERLLATTAPEWAETVEAHLRTHDLAMAVATRRPSVGALLGAEAGPDEAAAAQAATGIPPDTNGDRTLMTTARTDLRISQAGLTGSAKQKEWAAAIRGRMTALARGDEWFEALARDATGAKFWIRNRTGDWRQLAARYQAYVEDNNAWAAKARGLPDGTWTHAEQAVYDRYKAARQRLTGFLVG